MKTSHSPSKKIHRAVYVINSIYFMMGILSVIAVAMIKSGAEKNIPPEENFTAMILLLSAVAIAIVTGIVHATIKATLQEGSSESIASND